MEGTEEQKEEQPKQIYDADNDTMVDNPALKPDAKKEEPAEEEEDEEEPEVEEPEKEEPKKEEEEPEEPEVEKEKPTKEEEDEGLTPDAYVESVFGEKYGIKTEEDLTKIIELGADAQGEVKTLKEKLAAVESEGPKFKSPAQEAAYKLISQYDPKMQGEALQTYAKLIGMDIEQADPTMLLEEKFIHEHPEWTRAESQRMFKKEFAKKYTLSREKFDGSDEEYAEEQKDLEIMKKGDIARAKSYLTEIKSKHKPADTEVPKQNEVVVKAIAQNTKKYEDFVQKTAEVPFGEGEGKFVFKLDSDRKTQVSAAMKNWVSNPHSYDEKGMLIGDQSPEDMLNALIGGMFIKDIVKAVQDEASSKVKIKRVEEIEGKKPKSRKSPGGDGDVAGDDLDAQAMRLIKTQKAA